MNTHKSKIYVYTLKKTQLIWVFSENETNRYKYATVRPHTEGELSWQVIFGIVSVL